MSVTAIRKSSSQAKSRQSNKHLCPICEEGCLTDHTEINRFTRFGIFVQCECYFSVCDGCGSEQASAGQAKINKQLGDEAYQQAIVNLQGELNNFH